MGVFESKGVETDVYLAGEVDYRVLTLDRMPGANLGLRHATPIDAKQLPFPHLLWMPTSLTDEPDTVGKLVQYTELNRGPIWFRADNAAILPDDPLRYPPVASPPRRLCARVVVQVQRQSSGKFAFDCHIVHLQIAPEHPQFAYPRK